MPSAELLPTSCRTLVEEARWKVNGKHYSRTLEAWLKKQDQNADAVFEIFKSAMAKKMRKYGCNVGAFFTWHALSSSHTMMVKNGL